MKNQTGKYIKYAIGEIILVVIGILIALQINNWNEQTKKNKLKSYYKTSLISDLTKDTIQLNKGLKNNGEQKNGIREVINLINDSNTIPKDIFDYMLKNEQNLGLRVRNTYNSNTFDLLISTGNIELFSNEFMNDLMELNKLQKEEREVSSRNSAIYFETYNNYRTKFTGSYQISNRALIETLWKKNEIDASVVLFINVMSQRDHTIGRYIELSEKVKIKTEAVLKRLHADIDL